MHKRINQRRRRIDDLSAAAFRNAPQQVHVRLRRIELRRIIYARTHHLRAAHLPVIVTSPKGERQSLRLEQTGPGHYEARFPTKEIGLYMLNLLEVKDGQEIGSQVVGASVNYSPEFNATEPNMNLLRC